VWRRATSHNQKVSLQAFTFSEKHLHSRCHSFQHPSSSFQRLTRNLSGPSGPVKLAKKESKPAAAKAVAPKVCTHMIAHWYLALLLTTTQKEAKEAKPKPAASTTTSTTKKAAPKKSATKATTTKKAPAAKKSAAAKPKANTAKPRAKKTAKPSTAVCIFEFDSPGSILTRS
jgi:outer membrane biosynthesis protein TonB